MSKVYIITGCSSGFGRALAEAVLDRGDQVVLTARKLESIADLAEKYTNQALTVRLDVTNQSDRDKVFSETMQRFGRVDILVNNAGQGSLGAFEEFSSDQIRQHFEVNSFGVFEMSRAALPIMRQQRSGHILNITSVGGVASMGGVALYCATKFAVEGFSEGLRDEVKPLGIRVTIVEPGAFRTNFAGSANMRPTFTIDDYQPLIEPIRQYLYGSSGQQPGDPHKAALAMIATVESKDPPLRLMLGADAYSFWEQKNIALQQDLAKWRTVGEDTAYENAKVRPIGGRG